MGQGWEVNPEDILRLKEDTKDTSDQVTRLERLVVALRGELREIDARSDKRLDDLEVDQSKLTADVGDCARRLEALEREMVAAQRKAAVLEQRLDDIERVDRAAASAAAGVVDWKTGRPEGRDALEGRTLQLPPCGCNVEGAGTLPDPVRIVFCDVHALASPGRDAATASVLVEQAKAILGDVLGVLNELRKQQGRP